MIGSVAICRTKIKTIISSHHTHETSQINWVCDFKKSTPDWPHPLTDLSIRIETSSISWFPKKTKSCSFVFSFSRAIVRDRHFHSLSLVPFTCDLRRRRKRKQPHSDVLSWPREDLRSWSVRFGSVSWIVSVGEIESALPDRVFFSLLAGIPKCESSAFI